MLRNYHREGLAANLGVNLLWIAGRSRQRRALTTTRYPIRRRSDEPASRDTCRSGTKVLPQGGFQRTGFFNAPPQLLLTALSRLQATHMTEESRVPEFLAQLVAKSPQRIKDKSGYQGASNDRLYQADYDHVKSENPTCNECAKSHIIHRTDRDDKDPYFHYGIIASGSAAVKDGKTCQRLSEEYGALCFETEAVGLYDFPCLILHGIYDYADSNMSNLWQEYAAATAAAFAKELLLFVAPGRVRREKTTFYEVASSK
ncbi:hypothetical protein NW765_006878 [Fusarium oxysporum]|nr:hypothetical protein NW765_006878 [Fusarium oxysporum]KAJ4271185.1 hypothetical protein NW764_013551 [Fusarium oxysporum]